MNADITRGARIKVGRVYGTVNVIAAQNVWYYTDDGRYRCALVEGVERVHGNKHKPKMGWPV